MQTTQERTLVRALDEARETCQPPTWRQLASELGMQAPQLANIKAGSKKLSAEQVQKLASLMEADAGELWELQELEHARRKNPFRRGVAAIGALLGAFTAAVLIAGASGLSRSQADGNQPKAGNHALHIVGVIQQIAECLIGAFQAIARLMSRQKQPTSWAC